MYILILFTDSSRINNLLFPIFFTEFLQILETARKEGFVSIKWTNFAMFGASGVGKTSLLNLLLRKKPIFHHDSTTVVKSPAVCLVSKVGDNNDEDEGTSSSDESQENGDTAVTEFGRNIIIADGNCYWVSANAEEVKIKFIQALKHGVRSRNSEAELPPQLMEDQLHIKKSITGIESVKPSPITSLSTPMTKPQHSISTYDEFLELLSKVEKSDELYNAHMMYGLDSGGQAAFLDIAPALLRYNSLNMIVLRLDEKLDDKANFFFSVRGRRVGKGEKRQMSTLQLTKGFMRCKSQLRPPLLQGVENVQQQGKPNFVVVGTCYDKYEMLQQVNQLEESLDEKNDRLRSELKRYEDVRIDYIEEKDVIFPIDTTSRKKHERHIAKRIRQITSQSYITAEVPARWFFFQLELMSKAKGRRVISLRECLEIGKSIGMPESEVKAALYYFHNLTLYLYFADILPKVVFLDPQVLFDMLSQLIAVSYGGDRYDLATIKNLKHKGIFNRELLDIINLQEDGFSSDDFLKLMQGLLIISKIPPDTKYFIPCVLDTIDDPFENHPGENVEPLFLTWDDQLIPNGLFTSLVVFLLELDSSTKFKLGSDIYRNKVVLKCQDFGGTMHLLDQVEWLAIRYFGPSENCCSVRSVIHMGMKSVVRKFAWDESLSFAQEMFRCKIVECTKQSFHFCELCKTKPILTCSGSDITCKADTFRHLSWFNSAGKLVNHSFEICFSIQLI